MDTRAPASYRWRGCLTTAWLAERYADQHAVQLYSARLRVGIGANSMTYSFQFAVPANFRAPPRAGVGIASRASASVRFLGGSLPWLQSVILHDGVGARLLAFGIATLVVLLADQPDRSPKRPQDLGLLPNVSGATRTARTEPNPIRRSRWVAIDWSWPAPLETGRFWWLVVSYFASSTSWYAVQVHRTSIWVEIASPKKKWRRLGAVREVALAGIPGLYLVLVRDFHTDWGARRLVAELRGLAICYAALLLLSRSHPAAALPHGAVAGSAGLFLHRH